MPPIKIAIQLASLRLPFRRALVVANRLGAAAVEIDARGELRPQELGETGLREVRRLLEELLNQEAKIDQSARQKIESQKRTILEGSQEWDILYRKYYNEEVKKLGV